jgi:hypothetical protein
MSGPTQPPVPNFGDATKPQKRVLWKWSLAATAVLLILLLWQCGSGLYSGYKSGDQAVQHFHAQLNSGQFEEICSEADEAFSQSDKHEELVRFLEQVHKKLGNAGTAKQLRINVNATTGGTFVTAEFITRFDEAQADETFTWRKSGKDLKLYRYNIQSNAFLK